MKLTYAYTYTQDGIEAENLSADESMLINFLIARKKPVRHDILLKNMGFSDDSLLIKLCKKGYILKKEVIKKRFLEPTVKMVRICEGADIPERFIT